MPPRKANSTKSKGHRKPKRPNRRRVRDYAAEYGRRIALAESRGLSKSVGRGHARAGERPLPKGPRLVKPTSPVERALKSIRNGQSLRAAAKAEGVTEEHLRRYMKENTTAVRKGKGWEIEDTRPRQYPIFSKGEVVWPWLPLDKAAQAAKFMGAVMAFLENGKDVELEPFHGGGVVDVRGRRHPFETDFNRLYQLSAAGEPNYLEIYKIVAGATQ